MLRPGSANGEVLSDEFRRRLALSKEPAYRIAVRAGMHPSVLSKLLIGAERVKWQDPRIIAVGKELGLKPGQCFAGNE